MGRWKVWAVNTKIHDLLEGPEWFPPGDEGRLGAVERGRAMARKHRGRSDVSVYVQTERGGSLAYLAHCGLCEEFESQWTSY